MLLIDQEGGKGGLRMQSLREALTEEGGGCGGNGQSLQLSPSFIHVFMTNTLQSYSPREEGNVLWVRPTPGTL